MVSVLMLAWQHGGYVEQAVRSVMAQRLNGLNAELIIGVDQSIDDTLEICRHLQQEFEPGIRILDTNKRLGMHANFARLWEAAQGAYIAFCEGDDYWCDDARITDQVALLEAYPGVDLCGAYTDYLHPEGQHGWRLGKTIRPSQGKDLYAFEDLIPEYAFHFSSIMVRKAQVRLPQWLPDVYCVDRPMNLLAARRGGAVVLPRVVSYYRQHDGGVWSALTPYQRAQNSADLFNTLTRHFGDQYQARFRHACASIVSAFIGQDLARQDPDDTLRLVGLYWRTAGWADRIRNSRIIMSNLLRAMWKKWTRSTGPAQA